MELILSPNEWLDKQVPAFDRAELDPAKIGKDMISTMEQHSGLGISANQVGVDGQIFVMKTLLNKKYGSPLVVINPIIKGLSKEMELGPEGCLSHPDLFLRIRRPISCMVEFDTLANDMETVIKVETKFDDIDARIFLHEYDHLHGIEFTDRVSPLKLKMARKKQTKKQKRKVNG